RSSIPILKDADYNASAMRAKSARKAAHPSGGTCCSRRAWASQVFPVARLALRHPLDGGFETARSRFLGARVGDPVDVFAPHALAEALVRRERFVVGTQRRHQVRRRLDRRLRTFLAHDAHALVVERG